MPEILNEYELLKPFQNQNAGYSRWTIAQKENHVYFLKEFMDPKYPDEDSLRESLRKTRIKECESFETEKTKLYTAINNLSDGNLVRIEEFFRADSRYYIAADWIDEADLCMDEIAKVDLKDKLLLCRTAVHSLSILHSMRIIHSDIKDSNVIVHRSVGGKLVAKIIDFDCSFFEDCPPTNEDDLGGDQVYLSPEACMFFCGEDVKLTCKMDVFAMGLLFHQYLTGELPYFDKSEYEYAHEAVLDDVLLKADSADIPLPLREIIEHMLLKDADKRISASEVEILLDEYYKKMYPTSKRLMDNELPRDQENHHDESDKPVTMSSGLKMSKDFFRQAGDL